MSERRFFTRLANRFRASRAKSSPLVCLLLVGCGAGAMPPTTFTPGDTGPMTASMNAFIDARVREDEIASVAVTVSSRDRVLYERAAGLANLESEQPATLKTPYRWGSVSKVFVMLGLLQLADEELLRLDDPLSQILEEFHPSAPSPYHAESEGWSVEDITIRSLVTHTSGLANWFRGAKAPLPLSELARASTGHPATFPVGLTHSYSNFAYNLLGLAIERRSGLKFSDYMSERILRPAGMSTSSFSPDAKFSEPLAHGYFRKTRLKPIPFPDPCGALLSSPEDMARFSQVLLGGGVRKGVRLVSRKRLEEAYRRQASDVALHIADSQGLSFFHSLLPPDRFGVNVGHAGLVGGQHSVLLLLLDEGLAVSVVTNSADGRSSLNRILRKSARLAMDSKRGRRSVFNERDPSRKLSSFSQGKREAWVGHYATELGDLEIRASDTGLTASLHGHTLHAKEFSDGSILLDPKGIKLPKSVAHLLRRSYVRLARLSGRHVLVASSEVGRRAYLGVRYVPAPAPELWNTRLGKYVLVGRNLDGQYDAPFFELSRSANGQLLLALPSRVNAYDRHPMLALSDSELVGVGLGRGQAQRMRFLSEDRITMDGLVFERGESH